MPKSTLEPPRTSSPDARFVDALSSLKIPNASQAFAAAEELILKYPAAALASAAVLGVVVGWWIKRK